MIESAVSGGGGFVVVEQRARALRDLVVVALQDLVVRLLEILRLGVEQLVLLEERLGVLHAVVHGADPLGPQGLEARRDLVDEGLRSASGFADFVSATIDSVDAPGSRFETLRISMTLGLLSGKSSAKSALKPRPFADHAAGTRLSRAIAMNSQGRRV